MYQNPSPVQKIDYSIDSFYLTVLADGKRSENAHVLDGFPNDRIQRVNIVNGTIKVTIGNLLKIVPHPIPQFITRFVQIVLNPWEMGL